MYFVSIIIPAKNESLYIEGTLRSLLNLNYPRNFFEIILIDNGSEDNTVEIARDVLKNISNSFILHKPFGTIGSLRMHGVNASKGEILAFLDADCRVKENWLSTGIEVLNSYEEASCVGFAMSQPNESSSWVERVWSQIGNSSRYCGTVEVDWLCSFNLIVNREIFLSVGGFSQTLKTGEDFDLGLKLSRVSKIYFSDLSTVDHLDTVTNTVSLFQKEVWRGKDGLLNFFKSDNKKQEFLSIFIPIIFLCFFVLFLISPVFLCWWCSVLALGGVVGLPVLMVFRKRISGNCLFFLQVWWFYFVYLLARGVGALTYKKLTR